MAQELYPFTVHSLSNLFFRSFLLVKKPILLLKPSHEKECISFHRGSSTGFK